MSDDAPALTVLGLREMKGKVLLAALVGSGLPGPALAHRPLKADAFWTGLDRPAERAPARGVEVLRPPLSSRVRIPGGSFLMGSSPAEVDLAFAMCMGEMNHAHCDRVLMFQGEAPPHEVTLSAFDLDRTEVTVDAYARCVAVGKCEPPGFAAGDPRFDNPVFPVTSVRWEDATAYCSFAGGRLPTEAEWEFAARGPHGRLFPWGMEYNPHLANHGAFAMDPTDATDGYLGLAPVGSFPDGATPLGIMDLAGNAAEFVSDLLEPQDEATGNGYPSASQVNPKGPKTGIYHVVRGGSYVLGAPWMRAASRGARGSLYEAPAARSPTIGFRCAANPS